MSSATGRAGRPGGHAADGGTSTVRGILSRRVRAEVSTLLVRAARLADPGATLPGAEETAGRDGLDPRARERAVLSLQGELDDLVDDASERGVSDRSADSMLVVAAILRWLRDGDELPGKGAIETLEVHVAIFNGARREEERELQRAFRDVLGALVAEQVQEIAAERWKGRRIDLEVAEEQELRRFGERLEELRRSRGLSIGELVARSGIDAVTIVGLIRGARSVGSGEILLLAEALGVEPAALISEVISGAVPPVAGDEGRP